MFPYNLYGGQQEQTSKPNGVRIYGTWTATHTVSGATVNNQEWYRLRFECHLMKMVK